MNEVVLVANDVEKEKTATIDGSPELSIIIPTLNERDNIEPLVRRIYQTLGKSSWEVIFVDDNSPDGTSEVVKELANADRRVRCIRRVGRRGLSTAVIEGILSSSSKYIAVMDGDMQHDEALLKTMLQVLKEDSADVVIASRYKYGGHASGLTGKGRHAKSQLGNWIAKNILGIDISDPMSGFFMLPRKIFESSALSLSGEGFKILLDLLASYDKPLRLKELPLLFRKRNAGESKLDLYVEIAFASMIIKKSIGRLVPPRFIMFSVVGGTGVLVHLMVLKLALSFGITFILSQALAALVAMTSNFWLNNSITYRDQRLRGWRVVSGLLSFYAICSLGIIGNVGVAHAVFSQQNPWWLSGIIGAVVGAVWNYAASAFYIWRSR